LSVLRDYDGVTPVAIPARLTSLPLLQSQGFETASSLSEAGPLDAVIVATDTGRHIDDLIEGIACGARFVLVEKPLGTTVMDVARASQRYDEDIAQRIFVGYDLRFSPSLHLFRANLHRIGLVHEGNIECRSYLPDWRPGRDYRETYAARLNEGGVLRDLSHELDYACWLFGPASETTLVASLRRSGFLEIAGEDQANLVWNTHSGTRINVCLDYLSRIPVRRMTAYGEKGNLTWDAIGQTVSLDLTGHAPIVEHRPTQSIQLYRSQIEAFLSVLRGGSSGDLATFHEALAILRLCDAAFKFQETLNIRGEGRDRNECAG
jgi:predicted dehydrogenase